MGKGAVRVGFVSAAIFFTGCRDAFSPPAGTYRFDAPIAYQAQWDSVEACSGLEGDLARVQWHAVPLDIFSCGEGQNCFGAWRPPHNAYVTEWAKDDSLDHYRTVRHEMLHDLLGGPIIGDPHPPVFRTCGLAGR